MNCISLYLVCVILKILGSTVFLPDYPGEGGNLMYYIFTSFFSEFLFSVDLIDRSVDISHSSLLLIPSPGVQVCKTPPPAPSTALHWSKVPGAPVLL